MNENSATVFGGRELPSYKLDFTIKGKANLSTFTLTFVLYHRSLNALITHVMFLCVSAGVAYSFMIDAMSSTLHVGEPFDIPLLLKDAYGNLATPPPNLRPVLQCR